jgi:hypothetical protein
MSVAPPFGCILCGAPPAGAWYLPPGDGWSVARVLVLCAECSSVHSKCVEVPAHNMWTMSGGKPAYPFVEAAELHVLISCGVCWHKRGARALVPWCPKCGVSEVDEQAATVR